MHYMDASRFLSMTYVAVSKISLPKHLASVIASGWRTVMVENDSVSVVGWVSGMVGVTTDVEGKLFLLFSFLLLLITSPLVHHLQNQDVWLTQ